MNNEQETGTTNVGERQRCGGSGEEGERENKICSSTSENTPESTTIKRDTSRISTGLPESTRVGGQSTSGIRELPVCFSKSSENMEQQYWKGFKKRCDRILRELQNSDGQLVRDIFRFESARESEDFLNCVRRDGYYRRGLLQICREDTHIHIVHDCPYSNGSCRCNWFQKAKTYGADRRRDRRSHRRDPCRNRTATDIQNLLLYYCTKGRFTIYQKIRGQVEGIHGEGYNIQASRLNGLSEIFREMEIQIPGTGTELQSWGPDISDDEPDQGTPSAVPRRKKRKMGAQERIQLRTVELLETYPICPPEAIVKHKV